MQKSNGWWGRLNQKNIKLQNVNSNHQGQLTFSSCKDIKASETEEFDFEIWKVEDMLKDPVVPDRLVSWVVLLFSLFVSNPGDFPLTKKHAIINTIVL